MDAPPALPVYRDSWFAPLSIDLIIKVLRVTFFHPFLAWIIPLCFRAQTMHWDAPPMLVAIAFASFVTVTFFAGVFNGNLAYGMPRHVDLSDEVIVVTGGASGLGLLIAEVYGMRGASVAVLDVRDMDNTEARGVTYYRCDVSNQDELARVSAEIERDVCLLDALPLFRVKPTNPYTLSSARHPSSSTTPPLCWASPFSSSPTSKSPAPSPSTSSRPFTPSRPSFPA